MDRGTYYRVCYCSDHEASNYRHLEQVTLFVKSRERTMSPALGWMETNVDRRHILRIITLGPRQVGEVQRGLSTKRF